MVAVGDGVPAFITAFELALAVVLITASDDCACACATIEMLVKTSATQSVLDVAGPMKFFSLMMIMI